jgi:cell division initiation protein
MSKTEEEQRTDIMTLTPMDIHNKQFDKKMRGYDAEQVDAFLDRIVDAYGDALDKIVDLKNSNQELKAQVDKYAKIKDSLNDSLIEAQRTAKQVNADAKKNADDLLAKGKADAEKQNAELQRQHDSLQNDYELLKNKVEEFRNQTKHLLEQQVKELDDDEWQYYLDKYYGRSRLYPADGGEPIPTSEIEQQAPAVDNESNPEVNSNQADQPQIMAGDSPSHEEAGPQPDPQPQQVGPTVVFPDDYKDHD